MNSKHIGFLHPGAMGISLAATARNSGHIACWVSKGRSGDTRRRAEEHGLVEMQTLDELCEACSAIVCVCPPHAATEVARQVAACSFDGVYVDANAISPQRAECINRSMTDAGVRFVDGGIIGGPAWKPGNTWLHLAGPDASEVAECFAAGPLETEIIGDEIGKASALKICFAAHTKGATALLCAIVAAAEEMGIRDELEKQWIRYGHDPVNGQFAQICRVTAKAWRFAGEMDEIATTLEASGLPGGFHQAAGEIYRRIAKFKDADSTPPVEDVLAALIHPEAALEDVS